MAISISYNKTSRSFVVTDSENTFEEYMVDFFDLTPKDLKYRNEVIRFILDKQYSGQGKANIDEEALTAIDQVCETNRLFF